MKRQILYGAIAVAFISAAGFFVYQQYQIKEIEPIAIAGNPVPLSGQETALLIQSLYNELGPRIGSHLVEPNAVITLAGLRGRGNFLMNNLTRVEKARIASINKAYKKYGIEFVIRYYDELFDIYITNLKGLERVSKRSKLPFIVPFDAAKGFEGAHDWFKELHNRAGEYFKNQDTENNKLSDPIDHFVIGFELGYPDQALLDMYTSLVKGDKARVFTHIPYSDYYDNPQPNFSFLPEHENEKSIVAIQQEWGNLLKEFYNSPWPLELKQDPVFMQTRGNEKNQYSAWWIKHRMTS